MKILSLQEVADRLGIHVQTLNVEHTASEEEIKSAYRELARKNHPDAGGDAEKFIVITKAYEVAMGSL